MAEITERDVARILEVLCDPYNKIHRSNISPSNICKSFERQTLDVDIRLTISNENIDIQVVRPFGNPELEYERDALRVRINDEFTKQLKSEKLAGEFFWDMNQYPQGKNVAGIVKQCIDFIKLEVAKGRTEIDQSVFIDNAPKMLVPLFRDFDYKTGSGYRTGWGFSETPIDERHQVLNAINKKQDRKSTRLNSSHLKLSRMPSSA